MNRKITYLLLILSILAMSLAACSSTERTTTAVTQSPVATPTPSREDTESSADTVGTETDVPSEVGIYYDIVDTGQTTCYENSGVIACPAAGEAFYGQDAQYAGNEPSYTDNGDGTVTDNVTGLIWQQTADTDGDGDIDAADKLSYEAAGAHCENLSFADYDDWQLPDIKQLYSLIDFSGLDPSGYEGADTSGLVPFIDTDYFDFAYGDTDANERIIDAQYASSSLYLSTARERLLFGVNFADGRIKGYGLALRGRDKTFAVICTRENTSYGVNDFLDNGDGTITDNATGLMWAQDDSGSGAPDGLNWEEALAHVEAQNDANYLGYSDWRLPNVKELQSILDYSRSPDTTDSAAIDTLFNATNFTNEAGQTDYAFYWSSTTHANWTDNPGSVGAYVSFGRALGYMDGSWRDVHGAGAQRSDPKEGDPADWPTGHGPQGDAIRIYNYVRLVRGGTDGQVFVGGELESSAGNLETQPGNDAGPGQPAGVAGQRPDLAAAAAQLGVPEEALRQALGDPRQGPPDLAAAAQQLGVSEEKLRKALGAPKGPPQDGPPSGSPPANEAAPAAEIPSDAQVCLDNTRGAGECKDCCDSLQGDGAARKACRDECPNHGFSQNADFVTVNARSILGPDGDYAACPVAGDERTCRDCCDGSDEILGGDRRFCRDACAQSPAEDNSSGQKLGESEQGPGERMPPQEAIEACRGKSEGDVCEFTAQRGAETGVCEAVQQQLACSPQRERPGEGQAGENQPPGDAPDRESRAYNIEQALSDRAQGMTISFDALAFLTGDLGSDSFFPPGKVADFWGFQYLRDNDPSEMGHNTDFLTKAALNMLYALTPDQRAELVALAEGQVETINQYAYDRFVLMDAFRCLLEGDLPAGSTSLDEGAVKAYSAELYRLDGEISFERARVMGGMLSSLDAAQLAYLVGMVGQGMLDWPDLEEPSDLRNLDRDVKVAVMTYAGDMFSWYAGSIEADVYFCPERQGTYFGSFYLKDAPAMGNPDYSISSSLTGDMGDTMLGILSAEQAQLVTGLVDVQRPHLLGIVDARQAVSEQLRRFMDAESPDSATVMSLMEEYGELDGAIVYNFANNFAQLGQSITAEQQAQLMALRTEMLGDMLHPTGAYLYSQPIALPETPNSDFLFAVTP